MLIKKCGPSILLRNFNITIIQHSIPAMRAIAVRILLVLDFSFLLLIAKINKKIIPNKPIPHVTNTVEFQISLINCLGFNYVTPYFFIPNINLVSGILLAISYVITVRIKLTIIIDINCIATLLVIFKT